MKVFVISIFVFLSFSSCRNIDNTQMVCEKSSVEKLQDSIAELQNERFDFMYFDLNNNDDAMYFFHRNEIENPEELIISELMATNVTKDKNHPLIEYRPRKGKKFVINKIKALNHRWIICDFSDGLDWGELLIRYDLNDDKTLSFRVLDQILYPSEQKPY